jgi:hypothetical protein
MSNFSMTCCDVQLEANIPNSLHLSDKIQLAEPFMAQLIK